jgi:hypothetical protein
MHASNNCLYIIRPEKFSIARKSVDKKYVSPSFHLGQKARKNTGEHAMLIQILPTTLALALYYTVEVPV